MSTVTAVALQKVVKGIRLHGMGDHLVSYN